MWNAVSDFDRGQTLTYPALASGFEQRIADSRRVRIEAAIGLKDANVAPTQVVRHMDKRLAVLRQRGALHVPILGRREAWGLERLGSGVREKVNSRLTA